MIEKMRDSILAMAEAMAKPLIEPSQTLVSKEIVESTLEDQTQEKIQNKICLTETN